MTNLVKYFPPNDRDPNKEEIRACRPFLDKEIKRLNPDIIVPLGNIATRELLDDKTIKITEASGQLINFGGRKYFPILHPSFILRYPANLSTFEGHFRKLARLISKNGTEHEVEPTITRLRGKQVGKLLDFKKTVAFDYETTGFGQGSRFGKIRTISVSDGKKTYWVSSNEASFQGVLKDFLRSKIKKVTHNAVFEGGVSLDEAKTAPRRLIADTLAMHYLIDENSQHGLDALAMRYLNVDSWDIYYEMKQKGWTYATVPIEKLGHYNALDSYYTIRLYDVLRTKMDDGLWRVHNEFVLPLMKCCSRLERTGIKIDREYCKKLSADLEKEMADCKRSFLKDPKVAKAMRLLKWKDINLTPASRLRSSFSLSSA